MKLKCKNNNYEYTNGLVFIKKHELRSDLTVGKTYEVQIEVDHDGTKGLLETRDIIEMLYVLTICTDSKRWVECALPSEDVNGILKHFFHDPE